MKHYLGIDPGKNGGIALIDSNGNVLLTVEIPLIGKKEVDVQQLCRILTDLIFNTENIFVCLENVHAVQQVSATASFEFGKICGILEAIIYLCEKPFQKVNPKTWQKEAWLGITPIKMPSKEDKIKIDTKATSLLAVKRLYPVADLHLSPKAKNPHDGIVDAILIAHYGKVSNL